MPNFTYSMDDQAYAVMVNAFANNYGYQDEVVVGDGKVIPNPTSKAEFALAQVQRFITENVTAFLKAQADAVAAEHLEELKAQMTATSLEIKVEG